MFVDNADCSQNPGRNRSAVFVVVGLAIYAALAVASEVLARRTGHANAFYKIEAAGSVEFDWVIVGASHAMPLDFDGVNSEMEKDTGLRILNLAAQGAGPLYNRLALDHFFRSHRTRNVMYALDEFALYSRVWNEDRVADGKLLARTPFRLAIARDLGGMAWTHGVDPRAVLSYATGFAKVNNRERFSIDLWEGENQFDRVARPSEAAVTKRISYLYPESTGTSALKRYATELDRLVVTAQAQDARVTVVRMPLPQSFRDRLPEAEEAKAILQALSSRRQVKILDFSTALPELKFYFDTDHLNRAGVTEFFDKQFRSVLTGR